MSGFYRIIEDGVVVRESRNVITSGGKEIILKYLAGEVPNWAGSLSIGTGATAAASGDTTMEMEFGRSQVDERAAVLAQDKVVARAIFDGTVAGVIYELGLWSEPINNEAEYPGSILTSFDTAVESDITGGADEATNVRVGTRSLSLSPAASTSDEILVLFSGDFGGYQPTDTFNLAYFGGANLDTVEVRMEKDASNYYSYSFSPAASGYNIASWQKTNFVATGTLTWADISYIRVIVTATAGGTAAITLDAYRLNDEDTYQDFKLVSRSILGSPYTKELGKEIQIEYAVPISI